MVYSSTRVHPISNTAIMNLRAHAWVPEGFQSPQICTPHQNSVTQSQNTSSYWMPRQPAFPIRLRFKCGHDILTASSCRVEAVHSSQAYHDTHASTSR